MRGQTFFEFTKAVDSPKKRIWVKSKKAKKSKESKSSVPSISIEVLPKCYSRCLGIKYRQTRRSLLTKLIILSVKTELMHASLNKTCLQSE